MVKAIEILRGGSLTSVYLRKLLDKNKKYKRILIQEKTLELPRNIIGKHENIRRYTFGDTCYNVDKNNSLDGKIGETKSLENLEEVIVIDFRKTLKRFFDTQLFHQIKIIKYFDLSSKGDVQEALTNLYSYIRLAQQLSHKLSQKSLIPPTILFIGKTILFRNIKKGRQHFNSLHEKIFIYTKGITIECLYILKDLMIKYYYY